MARDPIPSVVKRCPQCRALALEFSAGGIRCAKCGFSEQLPVMR
ncbi:MAG TPA: hypothetical protein VJC16_06070 [Candidatus Nanoarchaeia archaeon]|nr:hypothetical protein [Candidatus Nanoarchaeia archaeon]